MKVPALARPRVLRRPRTTLAIAVLAVVAAAPGLWRLELHTDGSVLVPETDPAVREDRALRVDYRVRDPLFVLVPAPSAAEIFRPATLARVVAVTRALEALPGVAPEDVVSLATLPGATFRPGSFEPLPLLDDGPMTIEEAARVAREATLLGYDPGPLIAADGSSSAILVGVPPDVDRRRFYRATRQAAENAAPDVELAVVGAPAAETLLGHHVLADLGLPDPDLAVDRAETRPASRGLGALRTGLVRRCGLLPLAILVMAAVLAVSFRRPVAVAVPMIKVAAVLTVLFGCSGWLGVPFTLVTAVLPILLTAVGITDEIHLVRRLQELAHERTRTEGASNETLVARALAELTSPLVQTSVTTTVGFASFAASPIPAVRQFGLQAACGVGLCLLWALTVSPALLALAPRHWWTRTARENRGTRPAGLGVRFAAGLGNLRPRRLAVLALVAAFAVLGGVSRLEVQDSWLDGFDPESGFARVAHGFERNFRGLHRLLVSVEAPSLRLAGVLPDGALRPDRTLVLPQPPGLASPERWVGAALEFSTIGGRSWRSWVEQATAQDAELRLGLARKSGTPWQGRPPAADDEVRYRLHLSPFLVPEVLVRTRELEAFLTRHPGVGRVIGPTDPLERAARLSSFVPSPSATDLLGEPSRALAAWSALRLGLGPARLGQLVEPVDYSRTLVTVVLHEARYAEVKRLLNDLDQFAVRRLAPLGASLRLGGDVAVSQALIRSVVTTQWGSLALSLAGISLVAAVLGRSLGWGLAVVASPSLAVALTFSAMGWVGIPLGVATSMFAGMTLGIGVDAALHLLARHRLLADRYPNSTARVAAALASVLPAITIDTLAVGLGFGVLLLSPVPANARLAGLVMLTLAACWVATVMVVSALLRSRTGAGSP